MKTCEGCCGATSEVPILEPCPTIACAPCEETEKETDESASTSTNSVVRNVLIFGVLIAAIAFIQMNRRKPDNH